MSNPLAKLIQDSLAVLDAAGVEFLPTVTVKTVDKDGNKADKVLDSADRRNKFISDACSSRDGNAIATKMVLAKVSFTVARAQSRVNDKAGEATQAFAAAVSLVNVAESLCALHSVCDTGWTLQGSPGGVKPRKFGFATATVPTKFGLTDKQIETERKAA